MSLIFEFQLNFSAKGGSSFSSRGGSTFGGGGK